MNCETCTKLCKIRTARNGDAAEATMTVMQWKKTESGAQVGQAMRDARPKAPRAKKPKLQASDENEMLPEEDDPIFDSNEVDGFDAALAKLEKSFETMKSNANRLADVGTQLAPLVEKSQRLAGVIVGAGFYPTHVAVGPMAAHYAKVTRESDPASGSDPA